LTDGYVVGFGYSINGYTDSASNPTTKVQYGLSPEGSGHEDAISFPVKKGDYYRVDYVAVASSGLWFVSKQ
jgi:hypothetical protein